MQPEPLTSGGIRRHLFRLTLPTIGGMVAIMIFNVTDTFFVSRLGTEALAAMGFTFPVVMVIGTIGFGLGIGSSSVLSRAMGQNDRRLMQRTATDGLMLALGTVAIIGIAGWFTIDPLFRALGATEVSLPYIRDYMQIWYLGVIAVMTPPLSDGCLRATGDMIRPLIVMTTCAVVNAILDPLLIFGLWGFPELGMRGAAIATVIARVCGMIATLSFLHFHARLVDFSWPGWREVVASWKRILGVGVPAAATQLLGPITQGLLVGMAAAVGGAAAVAAMAAGKRIQGVAMIIPMSYGTALVPLVGQNWGGQAYDRVDEIRRSSNRFAWFYGLAAVLVFYPVAPWLARVFSDDPEVIRLTTLFLRIIACAQAGMNLGAWTAMSLNATGQSKWAALFNVIAALVWVMPLAILGRYLGGFGGMIGGLTAGQLAAGLTAVFMGRKLLRRVS